MKMYNLLLYEFVKKYERRFVAKIQNTLNFTKNEEQCVCLFHLFTNL